MTIQRAGSEWVRSFGGGDQRDAIAAAVRAWIHARLPWRTAKAPRGVGQADFQRGYLTALADVRRALDVRGAT